MINLSASRPEPNITTFYNSDVQAAQLQTEKALQRYSLVMKTIPDMATSYLPNHPISQAPQPHYAALTGSIPQLAQLESFADLQTIKGHTPLHYALAFKQKEAIRILVDRCDLSHVTPEGNTYLHYAALTGDPEILAIFLNRGIDSSIRNKDSLSAAHLWAFFSNDLDGLQKLEPENRGAPESFYFTPLQLIALNAAHANNTTLSDSEWQLFFTNLADLGVVSISWLCEQYRIKNYVSSFFELAHTGLLISKAPAIHALAPKIIKREINPEEIRQQHLFQWSLRSGLFNVSPRSPIPIALQSGASATAIAWNTFKELPKLMQVSWTSALKTTGIRLTNLAFGVLDTYLTLNYPRYEGYYCYTDAMKGLKDKSKEELLNLLSTDLVDQCERLHPELKDPNTAADSSSQEIKEIRKNIIKLIQPDKCSKDLKAKCSLATTNFNSLSEAVLNRKLDSAIGIG